MAVCRKIQTKIEETRKVHPIQYEKCECKNYQYSGCGGACLVCEGIGAHIEGETAALTRYYQWAHTDERA
jgi:hypothetical protein